MKNYLRDSLMKGEVLLRTERIKNFAVFHWIVFGICAIALGFSCVYFFGAERPDYNLIWLIVIFSFIGIFSFCAALLSISQTGNELGLTNNRLIGKIGLISVKLMDAPLDRIQNVSISYGLLGRILDFGTVSVNTASGLFVFPYVEKPEQCRMQILSQIEKYKEKMFKETYDKFNNFDQKMKYDNKVNGSLEDRFKKLKELYDSGMLTESEYNKKREELIKQI